ncbi:MAG: OmpA family protein [Filomicrobium sp.]
MMRTTLFVGLCCALSAPAAAEVQNSTLALGQFCKSTSSLVSCSSIRHVRNAQNLTGHQSIPGLHFALQQDNNNNYIQLAEAENQKDIQSALRDYINELLGFTKPEKKAETPKAPSSDAIISLPITDLNEFLKTRESWGTSEAKKVEAPLAPGAISPLPKTESMPFPKTNEVETIADEERPIPQMTAIPGVDIDKALSGLFDERQSWGTSPSASTWTPSEKTAPTKPGASLANPMEAATGDLAKYIEIRETWGQGTAKEVVAPPVPGAAKPSAPKGTDVKGSLDELLKTREGWGTEPAKSYRSGSLEINSGPEIKGTASLTEFLAQRASWGKGPAQKTVAAPLAPGAARKLAQNAGPAVTPGPSPDTIIHPYVETPLPKPALVSQADIVRARNALLEERASWGTAPSKVEPSVTNSVAEYLANRDRWGKGPAPKTVAAPLAAGASRTLTLTKNAASNTTTAADPILNEAETRPLPELANVETTKIGTALKDLFAVRESWGTMPTISGVVFAGDLNRYLARRDTWGKGPKAKVVKAPLVKGAPRKLKLTKALPQTEGAPAIVHELEAQPLPQMANVEASQITASLNDLFATRESWGTEPVATSPRFAGDLNRYLARRDAWGTGPKAKRVRAPLAKGASRKVRLAKARAIPAGKPAIVHELEARPLPQLTNVDAATISASLDELLNTRSSWGTEPVIQEARVAGDLQAFFARRERWGKGPKAKRVRAPLVRGASRKLKLAKALPKTEGPQPIVHELEARPLPQMAAVEPSTINSALKDLFSTRDGWGTEPKISGAVFAGDLNRYLARRDGWGAGPKAKRVRAPLAKGASRKVRLAKARAIPAGKPAIVHELEARPLPQLTAVASAKIVTALDELLATREGWGTTPSLSEASPIVTGSVAAPTASVSDYLAARDRWQNGGVAKPAEPKLKQVAAATTGATLTDASRTRCQDDLRKLSGNRSILFANASAELDSSSNKTLDQIAEKIRGCGNASVRIEGHTDSIGSAKLNKRLSEARAKTVLEYLTSAGVDRSRLEAIGLGESKPIASNATRKTRALNRRIEFTIK